MPVFKLFVLGIAILGVACGASVDAGRTSMDNGGFGNTMSAGGSQSSGTTPAAGSTNESYVVASSGGTAGSNYPGGLTPIPNTPGTQPPPDAPTCGGQFTAPNQPNCTYSLSPLATARVIASSNVSVVYEAGGSIDNAFLVGQSLADCSQGDGWYLETNGNIALCPKTCGTVQQDPNFVIRIIVQCIPNNDCICQ